MSNHITADEEATTLWLTLLEIYAHVEKIDISHVPKCVWESYAARGMTVGAAIKEATL